MAINLEEYQKLKKQADELKSSVLRAEGSLANLMSSLKKDYGVDSIEDAEKLLQSLTKERDEAETLFTKKMVEFKQKWEALKNADA